MDMGMAMQPEDFPDMAEWRQKGFSAPGMGDRRWLLARDFPDMAAEDFLLREWETQCREVY